MLIAAVDGISHSKLIWHIDVEHLEEYTYFEILYLTPIYGEEEICHNKNHLLR